jgi:ABC-type maltose transport system permease subunit
MPKLGLFEHSINFFGVGGYFYVFFGGMIPYFILIRNIGLYNTFWVYIIPTLFSVWNMIIIQNFIRELPAALIEAAKMDGCGEYSIPYCYSAFHAGAGGHRPFYRGGPLELVF